MQENVRINLHHSSMPFHPLILQRFSGRILNSQNCVIFKATIILCLIVAFLFAVNASLTFAQRVKQLHQSYAKDLIQFILVHTPFDLQRCGPYTAQPEQHIRKPHL